MNNCKSSTDPHVRDKVEAQILKEMIVNNYAIVQDKPTIVSAISAVPKPDSDDIRIIHDCSMPKGKGFNSYAESEYFRFQTLEDALKLVGSGYFLGKIHLKSAYRSVPIHPGNYAGTGWKWKFIGNKVKFTYFVDTRITFGGKKAPEIFNCLTQAVRRIMAKKGFSAIVVYPDDFLIIGESELACRAAFETLLSLLSNLGFEINWKEVVPPTPLVFLGVLWNTVGCTVSLLPEEKLGALKSYLLEFSLWRRASKRQLQVLAGKLNWTCRVVYWGGGGGGGAHFLRDIIDQMNLLGSSNAKF